MSRTSIPRRLRDKVARQANGRCGYCQTDERITGAPLEIEHLLPESRGGLTIEENLWLACSTCNAHKSNRVLARDPETGIKVQLYNPRLQDWHEHFQWSSDGTRIEGLTPIGRATVLALQLNRSLLVAARREWVRAGFHPPKTTVRSS